MQTSAPELIDLASETKQTLDMYGAEPGKPSFANNCLLARRLVERGVRFVQLYHTDWDHHGDGGDEPRQAASTDVCREVDQPCAALVTDLKQRGLLDDTLVDLGRRVRPHADGRDPRDRSAAIITSTPTRCGWPAAASSAGITIGETDELGYDAVEDRVHVHDLQATILHLLGLDHTKLTFRFQGRDFRLTDVHGEVVKKLLA